MPEGAFDQRNLAGGSGSLFDHCNVYGVVDGSHFDGLVWRVSYIVSPNLG